MYTAVAVWLALLACIVSGVKIECSFLHCRVDIKCAINLQRAYVRLDSDQCLTEGSVPLEPTVTPIFLNDEVAERIYEGSQR